uniref:C-type lectin domain family 12 member B-like isoform X2 n=1 Tax=Scatophagus argus TaxID=75038 RepID=UPI001ED7E9B7|nr:C-type lectin domain family 12 member B-like isoform X2 [Scatophagus argus]
MFRSKSAWTGEINREYYKQPNDLAIIYEQVKTGEHARDTDPVIPENNKKAPLYTQLHLVAACLGTVCIILVLVVIALSIYFNKVMSEQHRENTNLTAQNLLLWREKTGLERQIEDLTKEKDGLNWTIGVILEYENFAVNTHCPQKVCKPCLDGWVLFQSKCYLFTQHEFYSSWRKWKDSHNECRKTNADLVVIESQEEQEFINNHTKAYSDVNHGYWIGLSKMDDMWTWVDRSNFTVAYWKTEKAGYKTSCALSQPHADPLANWHKASCDMKNRWICEQRALVKESDGSSTLAI